MEKKVSSDRNKGKSRILFPEDYVVLDLETTGFSSTRDSIIEIAMLQYEKERLVSHFETFVKPPQPIPQEITDLTGISNYDVRHAPSIDMVIEKAVKFVGNMPVVGYGVNFDINFIYDNYMKCSGKEFTNDFVDVMGIAQKLNGRKCKLTSLAEHYGIDTTGAHRAINDCFFCHDCFRHLQDDIKKQMSLAEFSKLYDPVLKAQQLSLFDMTGSGFEVKDGRVFVDNQFFKQTSFKSSFGSHRFTPDELSDLTKGREIEIHGFKTKSGGVIDIKGRLGMCDLPNGKSYFGFFRTDLPRKQIVAPSAPSVDDVNGPDYNN